MLSDFIRLWVLAYADKNVKQRRIKLQDSAKQWNGSEKIMQWHEQLMHTIENPTVNKNKANAFEFITIKHDKRKSL